MKTFINIAAFILFMIPSEAFSTPPIAETFDKFNPILTSIGASKFEANILLTLATAEMAGVQDVESACAKWGCDNGSSYSVWQIQCLDRPGNSWNKSRWLWYLRAKLETPELKCADLNADDVLAAKAALVILRSFKPVNNSIAMMLKWGSSPDPHRRILLLRAIHRKIVKRQT